MTRWIVSTAAGMAALLASYGANLLICAGNPIGSLIAAGNALTLIP